MLAVSCASLTVQASAMAHLLRQRAGYDAERLAGHGMIRAAATRTALACAYTASAALALAGAAIPGAGVLSPEALVILIAAQGAWLYNAAMDVRIRHRLRDRGGQRGRGDRGVSCPCGLRIDCPYHQALDEPLTCPVWRKHVQPGFWARLSGPVIALLEFLGWR